MLRITLAAIALIILSGLASTQRTQTPPPCQTPEHRQFDFWIGSWNVFNPQGQQVGSSSIETGNGGCSIHESYSNAAGTYTGNSYNIYDQSRGIWHQTWVDNGGLLLMIEGGLQDSSMVLEGETTDPQGNSVLNRITWTPMVADTVRQVWESSTDSGSTWTLLFDGRYVRRD